jgi:hypothetical protein
MQHNSDISRWPQTLEGQKKAYANYAKYIAKIEKLCFFAGIEKNC